MMNHLIMGVVRILVAAVDPVEPEVPVIGSCLDNYSVYPYVLIDYGVGYATDNDEESFCPALMSSEVAVKAGEILAVPIPGAGVYSPIQNISFTLWKDGLEIPDILIGTVAPCLLPNMTLFLLEIPSSLPAGKYKLKATADYSYCIQDITVSLTVSQQALGIVTGNGSDGNSDINGLSLIDSPTINRTAGCGSLRGGAESSMATALFALIIAIALTLKTRRALKCVNRPLSNR